jgi:hypothetical protein
MEAIERRQHRVEVLATIVLAVAAVATAWSTYQSTQWRGQQASYNSKASAAHPVLAGRGAPASSPRSTSPRSRSG